MAHINISQQEGVAIGSSVDMTELPKRDPELLTGVFLSAVGHFDSLSQDKIDAFELAGHEFLEDRKGYGNRSGHLPGETDGERTRRLWNLGGLVVVSGLYQLALGYAQRLSALEQDQFQFTREILLGIFLELSERLPKFDQAQQRQLKDAGDKRLEERRQELREYFGHA